MQVDRQDKTDRQTHSNIYSNEFEQFWKDRIKNINKKDKEWKL